MEIEQATEQQLVAEAKKQTKAVELLAVLAQVWSVVGAIGLVIVLITLWVSIQR